MERIKILYTIPNFNTAGSGKVVYDLVKGLDRYKFEVAIACASNKGSFFKEVEELGIPIYIVETTTSYRPYSTLIFRISKIRKFFKKHNFDIVHSWHWSSDWTEALAARMAGVKWIYTKKAMSWGNRHWKIRSFLANYIITINEEMMNYFPNRKNQKLIPIGIDTDYYKPINQNIEKDSHVFKIITVANLVPVKGIEVLMKALKLMEDASVYLMVVGDNENEYGKMLLQLGKELSIENNVKFTGKVADVRPFIEEADVYVIPTLDEGRKEGMPMALVEAMAMAIPVLGSDISGINYVLGEFPKLLFKAGNELELRNKLIEMKNRSLEERNMMGLFLRNYCINNFSMDIFISEHENLYKSL